MHEFFLFTYAVLGDAAMKKIYIIFAFIICLASFGMSTRVEAEIEKKIIIDPGHGGRDGGASANGYIEADLNLEISYRLKSIFEKNGYKVDMTRYTDEDLSEGEFVKRNDMNQRVNMINKGGYLYCISIHQNTFTDSKYNGAQVFYSNANPLNKILATDIQDSLKRSLDTKRSPVLRDNIYLLNKIVPPSVIVECGFITNIEEAKKLSTREYQVEVAYSIYQGCIRFEASNL